MKIIAVSALIAGLLSSVGAFAPVFNPSIRNGYVGSVISNQKEVTLSMAAKKKRRRRIQSPSEGSPPTTPTQEELDAAAIPEGSAVSSGDDLPSIDELRSIASFSPPSSGSSAAPPQQKRSIDAAVPSVNVSPMGDGLVESSGDSLIELPDIRNVLRNKELKKLEEEEAQKRVRPKISRKDRKAMLQVSSSLR